MSVNTWISCFNLGSDKLWEYLGFVEQVARAGVAVFQ